MIATVVWRTGARRLRHCAARRHEKAQGTAESLKSLTAESERRLVNVPMHKRLPQQISSSMRTHEMLSVSY